MAGGVGAAAIGEAPPEATAATTVGARSEAEAVPALHRVEAALASGARPPVPVVVLGAGLRQGPPADGPLAGATAATRVRAKNAAVPGAPVAAAEAPVP